MLKNILYITIFTACVVVASVVLSIYHNVTATTAATDTTIKVTAIPSTFDFGTVAVIQARTVVPVDLTAKMSSVATGSSPLNTLPLPAPTGNPANTPASITPTPTIASSSALPFFLQSVPTPGPNL